MRKMILFVALLGLGAPALAQPYTPATEAEIVQAGEIWAGLQETLAPWAPKRPERGEDGKVRLEAVLYNVAVRDLAWMIHNRYPPLVAALGGGTTGPDARCAAVDSRWPGLVDRLAK